MAALAIVASTGRETPAEPQISKNGTAGAPPTIPMVGWLGGSLAFEIQIPLGGCKPGFPGRDYHTKKKSENSRIGP
jgi:hypothetical protein